MLFNLQIKAIDDDSGLNAKLSYAITNGNNGNVFGINSDGNITVERNLDRETVPKFLLKISAIDSKLFISIAFFSFDILS